tara:strand:+ start:643 stop:831 length:189 start_codon:yes stop_codon:yes gene_type:complete
MKKIKIIKKVKNGRNVDLINNIIFVKLAFLKIPKLFSKFVSIEHQMKKKKIKNKGFITLLLL